MEMNSNYESLRTNQSSRTVVYDVLALDQKSSAPDHPRSDPMYDEINEDYTKPELYTWIIDVQALCICFNYSWTAAEQVIGCVYNNVIFMCATAQKLRNNWIWNMTCKCSSIKRWCRIFSEQICSKLLKINLNVRATRHPYLRDIHSPRSKPVEGEPISVIQGASGRLLFQTTLHSRRCARSQNYCRWRYPMTTKHLAGKSRSVLDVNNRQFAVNKSML